MKIFQCCVSCVFYQNCCWLCCANVCCQGRGLWALASGSPKSDYLSTKLPLPEVLRLAKTGDIILFSSANTLTKMGTNSLWTHVNMVYRPNKRVEPMCFEVTLHKWIPTRHKGGAQLVPLREKIETYDVGGRFAWRKLRHFRLTKRRKRILKAFFDEIEDKPYQRDHIELVYAGLGFGNDFETLDSYFCSEGIAEAYKRLGLLPPEIPSNRYAPADFGSEARAGNEFILLGGARLSPEIEIVRNEDPELIAAAEHRRHHLNTIFLSSQVRIAGDRAHTVNSAAVAMNPAVLFGVPFLSYRGIGDDITSEDHSTCSYILGKTRAYKSSGSSSPPSSLLYSEQDVDSDSYYDDSAGYYSVSEFNALPLPHDPKRSTKTKEAYHPIDNSGGLPPTSSSPPAVHFAKGTEMGPDLLSPSSSSSSSSSYASPVGSAASGWSSDSHVGTILLVPASRLNDSPGEAPIPDITASSVSLHSRAEIDKARGIGVIESDSSDRSQDSGETLAEELAGEESDSHLLSMRHSRDPALEASNRRRRAQQVYNRATLAHTILAASYTSYDSVFSDWEGEGAGDEGGESDEGDEGEGDANDVNDDEFDILFDEDDVL